MASTTEPVNQMILRGTSGSDSLTGGDKADAITGGLGNDTLTGGAGSDLFDFTRGDGSDMINDFATRAGGDVLRLSNYGFTNFASLQAAIKQVGADTQITLGNGEVLTLRNVTASSLTFDNVALDQTLAQSGASRNWFSMAVAGATLNGTAGNDTLSTNALKVTLVGGKGDDIYMVGDASQSIVENAGEGTDTVQSWAANYFLAAGQSVENLVLQGSSNLNGTGNELDNLIIGNSGSNILAGGRGNDFLTSGGGSDTFVMKAGDGFDVITDFTAKGTGSDTLRLEQYVYAKFSDLQSKMGQIGADVAIYLSETDAVTLKNTKLQDLSAQNFTFGATSSSMILRGTSGSDSLTGGDKADAITGGLGNDTLTGGAGSDLFDFTRGDGSDMINDFATRAGGDVLRLSNYGFTNFASLQAAIKQVGADTQITLGNGEVLTLRNVTASSLTFDNVALDQTLAQSGASRNWFSMAVAGATLNGTAGNDTLSTNALKVTLVGGKGDDIYMVGDASQSIVENAGEGTDTVQSWAANYFLAAGQSVENLVLQGSSNLNGTGNELDNLIIGNSGSNILAGGRGNDFLTSGGGSDTFVMKAGDGFDVITDFTAKGTGSDTLRLEQYVYAKFSDLQSKMGQIGADVAIYLSETDAVTLKNTKLQDLSAQNFTFLSSALPVPAAAMSGNPVNWISASNASGLTVGSTRNDQIAGGPPGAELAGGAGDDTYLMWSISNVVRENAGDGVDTIESWTGEGIVLPDNVENLILRDESDSWAKGNDLNNILTGNAANNQIIGAGGNDILAGGGGHDVFIFRNGDGRDIVSDFNALGDSRDAIRLDDLAIQNFADVSKRMSQVGTDTVLDLGEGQMVTLKGVTRSSLTADNFWLPLDKTGFTQTFRDDFDSFSTYASGQGTWSTRYANGGIDAYTMVGNGEQQLYVDPAFSGLAESNAGRSLGLNPFTIEDGSLVITAMPFSSQNQQYVGNYGWSSGLITTQNSFSQTYGYFEITATLPEIRGAWPAFWLLPADGSWPPELDIFEYLGRNSDTLSSAVHSGVSNGQMSWQGVDDLAAGAHTFGAKWTPYGIDIYIDDKPTAQYATPDDMSGPMYMLANLAMGGHWPGSPDAGATAQVNIDSINAYQLTEYTLEGYTLRQSATQTRTLSGTAAAETLLGTAENEQLVGNGGADKLVGGLGDDTYIVTLTGTAVVENLGEGIDTVRSSATLALPVNVENLVLTGGSDIDATGNWNANIITGNSGANLLVGGKGNDVLTGGSGDDIFAISKGDGSDIIKDFSPGDVVRLDGFAFGSFREVKNNLSQHGADVYLALDTNERLVFRDRLVGNFTADDFQLPDQPPAGQPASQWVIGTRLNETLVGTSANEGLTSGGGTDVLMGGQGDDHYIVGDGITVIERFNEGVDTVQSWLASYSLPEHVENIQLMAAGSTGIGNGGSNTITGTTGNDTFYGMDGNDWHTGSGGSDRFIFDTKLDPLNNVDRITDFDPTDDLIYLSKAIFFSGGNLGPLNSGAFASSSESATASQRILYDPLTGQLSYDQDGNGPNQALEFAQLQSGLALRSSDFVII